MTASVEYNKIHALARARKVVMQKFGSDLLHFWPMADDTPFIRDLLRRKVLVGQGGVSAQAPGMLDYGMDMGAGYISDEVADQGGHTYGSNIPTKVSSDYYLTIPVPEGRWKSVKFRNTGTGALSPGVILALPDVAPGSVSAQKILQVNSTVEENLSLSYSVAEATNGGSVSGGQSHRFGQRITLNGALQRVSFYLKKNGSPTGTGYVKVYRVSDNALLGTANTTIDVSTLTGTFARKDFYFNTPLSISSTEVRVVFEFTGGDGTNYVIISEQQSDVASGLSTRYNGSSWSEPFNWDIAGDFVGIIPLHRCDFPFNLDAHEGQYWLYLKGNSHYGQSSEGMDGKLWSGSEWENRANVLVSFQGAAGESWPSHDKLTIGALVNVDNSPVNGMAVCLATSSEAKAYIKVKSDKKVEGFFKNTNGTSYTLTSTRALHPGHNLVTLSYERNTSVKLAVNGEVVATTTPSDHPLFNTTLAVAIGAQKLQGGSVSSKLASGVVDDVWVAKGVVADAALWDLYASYLTAAPMMQFEDVTPTA